jgi:hypothetical protein
METIRFNRHEIFTSEDHEFYSQTMRQVEDHYMSINETWYNALYNELCGIWDGYLYWNLLGQAKEAGLPESILERLRITTNLIKKELGE